MTSKLKYFFLAIFAGVLVSSCAHKPEKKPTLASTKFSKSSRYSMTENFGKKDDSKKRIYRDLAGKMPKASRYPSQAQLTQKPLSAQHYFAGKRAAEKKDYIRAIRHLNAVITRFPSSKEYKQAILAKAQLYEEMGLNQPASLNYLKAKVIGKSSSSKKAIK